MRLFLPVSATLFALASSYYLYTYLSIQRFTNMGMLLYLSSLTTFLLGILSEQVSALHYKDTSRSEREARHGKEADAGTAVPANERVGAAGVAALVRNDPDGGETWRDAA